MSEEIAVPGKGKAVASLVLGIISLVLLWFGVTALIAIVTSIIGIVLGVSAKKTLPPNQRGMATAGLICSIVGLVLAVIFSI